VAVQEGKSAKLKGQASERFTESESRASKKIYQVQNTAGNIPGTPSKSGKKLAGVFPANSTLTNLPARAHG
jgi:hypothetical protein